MKILPAKQPYQITFGVMTVLTWTIVASTWAQTATVPSPGNNAPALDISSALQVSVTDAEGDALDVTFFGRATAPAPGPDFSIIALPDTQYYSRDGTPGKPSIFTAQTDWIVANKAERNIQFVTLLGDCVENGDNNGNPREWLNATNALYRLEDPITTDFFFGIPYGVAVGNHDQSPVGNADGTTTFYNQYFGINHFTGRDYYGGHYGDNNDNHFQLFSASGLDFILIHVEYDTTPDAVVLDWTKDLLQTFRDRRAIIVSHFLINPGNPGSWGTQGRAIYNAVKESPNAFLMLCGHQLGEGRRVDTWNGNTLHSLLSDYQGRANGGDGWLRIMEFSPANNEIRVSTYSPTLDQFETDRQSEFVLSYNMTDSVEEFVSINSQTGIASGSTITQDWPGLSSNTAYEWFVTASDGVQSVSSPVWRFTTENNAPPGVTLTSPDNEQAYIQPATVTLTADASDPDGGIEKVEFYLGLTKLGEDATHPYSLDWAVDVEVGNHLIRARAVDDTGLTSSSDPINILVDSANPLDHWEVLDPIPTEEEFHAVTFGDGQFLAVGTGGIFSTSSDGRNWTQSNLGISTILNGIAYGNGTVAAVGDSGQWVASSDGVTWTVKETGTLRPLVDITYGDGRFVAVANQGTILTSANGEINVILTSASLSGVTFGGGTYVGVGGRSVRGRAITSTDGIDWPQSQRTASVINGVAYGKNSFVAVGNLGTILTSSDGIDWVESDSGTFTRLLDVTYADGIFIAVGGEGTMLSSSDGKEWHRRYSGTTMELSRIAYGMGDFVALGEGGMILRSSLPTLVLEAARRFDDGNFGFSFIGEAGESYTIESSEELRNWLQITNVIGADARVEIVDTEAKGLTKRFYRVRVP